MAPPLSLAHLSDPHAFRLPGLGEWNGKRLFGSLNWVLARSRQHRFALFEHAVRDLCRQPPDVVLCTGDLGQLGLPAEFEAVEKALAPLVDLGVPVLLTPGNHDRYGGLPREVDAFRQAARRLSGEAEQVAEEVYRIRETEILLLCQACPVPLFNAWGRMEGGGLAAVRSRLAGPAPAGGRIVAGHYPLRMPDGRRLARSRRLQDDDLLLRLLVEADVPAYFCGHIHTPYRLPLAPGLMQYCAGSVTTDGAVFRYEIDPGGVRAV